MPYSNKHNIPDIVAQAIIGMNEDHVVLGEFSVTELITPPQILYLKRKHAKDIVTDVSDLLKIFYGKCIHDALEKSGRKDFRYLTEYSVTWVFFDEEGKPVKISGTVDQYDKHLKVLSDYKCTSVYAIIFGGKAEWEAQLNIYRGMMRLESKGQLPIDKMMSCIFMLDHSATEASRDATYPQCGYGQFEQPVWDEAKVKLEVARMASDHRRAEKTGHPRPCTDAERWAKPDTWAVMRKGRQSALKRCASPKEAEERMASEKNKTGLYVEHRKGKNTRCELYCPASPFCSQYKAICQPAEVKEKTDAAA